MSIASEITRIQNAKSALKTAINAKTDGQHQITNQKIDAFAEFVNSITTDVDTHAYKVASVQEMNQIDSMSVGDYCVIDVSPYLIYQYTNNGWVNITESILYPTTNVTPTTSAQTLPIPNGYRGLKTVNVGAVTSAIDSNIIPDNIRLGVDILGVTGTCEPDKPDQTKTVTPTSSQQVITPDTGYELASVTVNATPTETKSVTPSASSQTIYPTSGKFISRINVAATSLGTKTVNPSTSSQNVTPTSPNIGLSRVTVNAVTSSIDANITAGNIKDGVSILGVTGSYTGTPIDTGAYQVETVDEMNALTDMNEGDLCVVYSEQTLGPNLFDISNAQIGKEINGTNIVDRSDYFVTDYMPVKPGKTYAVIGKERAGNSILFYNANKNYVSKASDYNPAPNGRGPEFTVPNNQNIAYAILNGALTQINTFEFREKLDVNGRGLPNEYQEVEYLQSSGTQYIDTGYKPYKTMGEIKFKINSTNINTSYIASVKGSNTTRYFIACYNKLETVFNIVNNDTGTWYVLSNGDTNPHTVLCNDSTNKVYFDGVEKTTIPDLPRQAENNLCLFALNNQGTIQDYFVGRIYYLKLWDKDTGNLVRNMIPCYRKSDNVAGMYDTVNDVFYTNSGTGTFTVGSDVVYMLYQIYQYTGSYWSEITDDILTDTSINPATTAQLVPIPAGYRGLKNVTVNPVTSSIDANIVQGNIKDGVTILGVTGTLSGIDTSDATAIPLNIRNGKTAYINGAKVTGTLPVLTYPTNPLDPTDTSYEFQENTDYLSEVTREGYDYIVGGHTVTLNNVEDWMVAGNPKMKMGLKESDIATLVGLTADKLRIGNTILGVVGSYNGVHTGAYKVSSVQEMNAIDNMETGDYCIVEGGSLPSAYKEVEYLQSNGTQYINSGIYPYKTKSELKVQVPTRPPSNCHALGCYNENNNRYYPFYYHYSTNTFKTLNRNNGDITLGNYDTDIHILIYNDKNNKVYFDGVHKATVSNLTTQAENPILVFARHGDITATEYFYGRIYYLKITDKNTNTLVRHFIPCVRKSDSVAGMYDLVNNVFYTNQGTGTFTVGAEVINYTVYRYNGASWIEV